MKVIFLLLVAMLLGSSVNAQDFVYKPVNPAFGGDTFNYQWMISSAQAQDTHKDPSASSGSASSDPLDRFEQDMNRQILYQLSRKLINDMFGKDGLKEGTYDLGSYHIQVTEGADGVSVSILDIKTGGKTDVTVPTIK